MPPDARQSLRMLSQIALLVLTLPGCEVEPQPLTLTERLVVDSLYRAKVTSVSIRMDSICRVQTDSLIAVAVDSMMEARLNEIVEQLRRIQDAQ
jgi:hypothetical protein